MKAQIKLHQIVILLILLVISNSTIAKMPTTLGVDNKIGINYVTHLYTLGNIGYTDAEYVSKYEKFLPEQDKNVLLKHKDLLIFGQGRSGDLTSFFFFIPAYSDLKSFEDYNTYFTDIAYALDHKTTKPLEKYIQEEYIKYLDIDLINSLASMRTEFEEISHVFLNNIKPYVNDVYPGVEKDLRKQKNYLNAIIAKNDIINKWEEVTNYTWNKGDYIYLLFRAGKKGPSFNNLSENINSCYYKIDEKYIVDMFSHEFGVFLMYDSIMPLAEIYKKKFPDYESKYTIGRPYWMANEMLSVFFNMKINEKKTMDYYVFKDSDPKAFLEIYSQLHEQGVTNPKDLYRKGIEEYMKPNGYWEIGVKERYEEKL